MRLFPAAIAFTLSCSSSETTLDAPGPVADAPGAVVDAPVSTSTFEEGANGYAGTRDTALVVAEPDQVWGAMLFFGYDTDYLGGRAYGLLRFDDIFGPGPGQVPTGASIVSATVTVEIDNPGSGAATVHEVLVAWDEDVVTYNTFGPTAGVTAGVDHAVAAVANAPSGAGSKAFDVTSSVTAWSLAPAQNLGWIIVAADNDGCTIRSSESPYPHPLLRVEWRAP